MLDIRIEASPEELADLRGFLLEEMGDEDDFDLQEISSVSPSGELREPLLIDLIVALGGPAVVTGFVTVVKHWLEHREKMKMLDYQHDEEVKKLTQQHEEKVKKNELRIAILHGVGYELVSLDELPAHASKGGKQ